uniref:Uncharacterized protein n=1 Tax=Rhizophora mucronata TaxID=61149 RepID=A0A2P2NZA1_RHIMU
MPSLLTVQCGQIFCFACLLEKYSSLQTVSFDNIMFHARVGHSCGFNLLLGIFLIFSMKCSFSCSL